jgi:hypothetical protein
MDFYYWYAFDTFKQKWILCWGNANQILEFTTTENVAEFTAAAAVDENTPRYLRIAGDKLSCNDFVKLLTELTTKIIMIFRPGGWSFKFLSRWQDFFHRQKKTLPCLARNAIYER